MTRHKYRSLAPGSAAHRAGRDAMAIATGAPQVIAMRLSRMAAHGANPSPGDRREMHRMVSEKTKAFNDAWSAMGAQSMLMQQAFWQVLVRSWWQPMLQPWWLGSTSRLIGWPTISSPLTAFSSRGSHARNAQALAATMSRGVAQMTAAGLAPLSRRVRSNVTRLGTRRTR